ncbi:cobalamin B12-binding domain-containing protein [Methylobacterium sp. JK268]
MGDHAQAGVLPAGAFAPRDGSRDGFHGIRKRPRWRDDLAQVVEAEIIPRLMLAHRGRQPVARVAARLPDADNIAHLTALLLAPQDRDAMAAMLALLEDGLTLEGLLVGLLAPTARHIGRLWEEDACDFVQVTVAMARLRRIVHDLETLYRDPQPVDPASPRILLLPAPGETHTFGLTFAAHFFAEAGWEVVTSVDACHAAALARLRTEWFDVVGLSLSCDVHFERLVEAVPAMRRISRNRDLGVLVGGPAFLDRPDRVLCVGADASAADVRDAPGIARRLLDLRVRAC